ncbi:tryptophan--tRNA ligase [archaeon]|nr:tryptophan--tRNA ligase [archaeon]|tara:strand:- start:8750 stop:9844 length:1095 start_codon:yes stop_codon:yes gene_type:complete
MKQQLDPWGSSNIENYNRLMKEFGITPFSGILKKVKKPSLYMKRGIIYGHIGFQEVLNAINKKEKFVMLTGLMPSGAMHMGHKLVADQMVYYQSLGAECFITVADVESYLTRNISIEDARKTAVEEYLLSYIALGLKPKNCHFYFQSNGSVGYNNLSKYVSKKITFNGVKSLYGDITPGKIVSALTQVADILHPELEEFGGPRPVVVPVGSDQHPHMLLSRDIATRMKEYGFVLPAATYNKFLPGLMGVDTKMSSSKEESFISLKDTEDIVEKKIKKYAFSGGRTTLKEHRKKGGKPEVDVSYQWLTFLEENDSKLKKIYNNYKSGKLLSGELKEILIEKLNKFLKDHQRKREKARKIVDKFLE